MCDELPTTLPGQVVCPGCNLAFEAQAGEVARAEQCPHCGQPVLIPAIDGATEIPEESQDAAEPVEQDEIDGLRIRQVARQRRSLIRSRSHALIGSGLGLVGAAELVYFGVRAILHRRSWTWPAAYLAMALLLLWLVRRLGRLAANMHRQSKATLLDEPTAPPDFSTLQDGSQVVDNLKKMHEQTGSHANPPPEYQGSG